MRHLSPINRQTDIFDHFLELIFFLLWISALEVIENAEMFLRSQEVKQDIVLWANTHKFTHITHFLEDISVIYFSTTF